MGSGFHVAEPLGCWRGWRRSKRGSAWRRTPCTEPATSAMTMAESWQCTDNLSTSGYLYFQHTDKLAGRMPACPPPPCPRAPPPRPLPPRAARSCAA
ncbi:hypothetical protein AMP9_2384 [plant metagenome]|uniref:Uncharacterized protein n=1 Tax=plant metagenome TaxID=1297885 RepID=A0A484NW75_9ZZZZ